MTILNNKNILLGVTGSIAAFKAAELVRRLKDHGANVHVVMSEGGSAFITPLTFQALSGNPVHTDLLDPNAEAAMGHIELARWADLVVIAPASADCIAKIAHGFANDLLSTLCLATTAPIAVAPAMNQQMWQATATQENLTILRQRGIAILGPDSGEQACGDIGFGRLLEPNDLVDEIHGLFIPKKLQGRKILITAGPTQEAIDPVRYLSNHSSGKMGYALAQMAKYFGAEVIVISGPVAIAKPHDIKIIDVTTAVEMQQHVLKELNHNIDIFIGVAAVSDFKIEHIATQKIAKEAFEKTLTLQQNPDILADVAKHPKRPFVVGFAAQTEDLENKAREKLIRKKADLIFANPVGLKESGFGAEKNSGIAVWKNGEKNLPLQNKIDLAFEILSLIAERYAEQH